MLNIAIDGHVGSGKSTLSKGLAKRLNLRVLDTGAIYRGIACRFKAEGLENHIDEGTINKFVEKLKVQVKFDGDLQRVIVDGVDYTPWLRKEETSVLTSKISPFPKIRDKVLDIQRDFAKKYDCVIEGRDIGTVVLPNADVKFFITASEKVRAQRRYDQIKNLPDSPSYDEILKDLRMRDYQDEHRKIAPLKPAKDSIIMDTSEMTLEQTIEKCVQIIQETRKEKSC